MKKVLVLVLVLALVMSFAACGSSSAPKGMKVLTVAVDDTYPPMEFRDENNELVGLDIDFTEAIAAEMGVEVEYVIMGWDAIFAALVNDKYDCIISSVSTTKERQATIDFSIPYLANGQVIMVVPGDDSITTMADLAGKKVGVQFETTADIAAQKALETVEFELVAQDDMTTVLAAMEAGKLDCIVADYAVAAGATAAKPDSFAISSVQLTNEPIAVAINKGNTELVEAVNAAITTISENGTLSAICIKYLDADMTQNIDTELR